jgi:zinc-ribbon domain
MFCSQCGDDIADDSQFCKKCGKAVGMSVGAGGAAVAPARIPRPIDSPKQQSNLTKWILGIVLFFFACWGVWDITLNHIVTPSSQQGASSSQPQPQLHTETIGDVAFTVRAGGTQYYKFSLPAGAFNVILKGHFTASGGRRNDIRVYVVNEDQYVNLQNDHPSQAFYNSGQVTQDTLNVPLPASDVMTTYYVAFSNRFSFISPKAVQASLDLTYYTR